MNPEEDDGAPLGVTLGGLVNSALDVYRTLNPVAVAPAGTPPPARVPAAPLGVPWYVWAGGAVLAVIALVFALRK